MNAQHTPGRLKVQHPHAGERGWEIAFEPGLEQVCQDVTEANARRLAACWNALIDLPQEALDGGWTRAGLEAHALKVEQQRDELLAALKECVEDSEQAVTDYLQKYGFSYRPERLTAMSETVAKARAAIAKAEGGAS